MQNLYLFNEENKEYSMSIPYEDGAEIPSNGTLEVPPETEENETLIYNDGWEIVKDYRFTHKMCKTEGNKYIIENIEQLGEIPEGWELITNEVAEERAERNRINSLNMTKYDFYKYVCIPNEITYATLINLVNSDENIAAAWNLCERVYRGDADLITTVKKYIPAITDEILDALFIEHGKEPTAVEI